MSANTTVYTGLWINWSKGVVSGATLTLSVGNGGILIAVLAIFVQLAGGQSWSIICFVTHQLRTTPIFRNGLFHQQQTTLRNNSSDLGTIWQLAKLGWAWRYHDVKSNRKSLPLILTGLLHFLAFGAAGVLSSHLSTLGNEVVLARSQSCGIWKGDGDISTPSKFAQFASYNIFIQGTVHSSNRYVQDCLVQSNTLPECNIFKRPQLNWTSNLDAPCPFDSDLCLGPVNSSLFFDTGLIDSRDDLGINTEDKNRVQYRKTTTCNPLVTQGHVFPYNITTNNITYKANAAFYGPNLLTPSSWATNDLIKNATYVTSNFQDFQTVYDYSFAASPYTVNVEASYPYFEKAGFAAIPTLYSPNNTITLVFGQSAAVYTGPSDDLWLPAHRISSITDDTNGSYTSKSVYKMDKPINVLACIEQHQFCNPSTATNRTQHCTPLQSLDRLQIDDFLQPAEQQLEPLFDNQYQFTIMALIRHAASLSTLFNVVHHLDSALLAESLTASALSMPLPSNQWILEAQNWFAVSLANIQQHMVNTALGPPGADAQYTLNQINNDTELLQYCKNQIIKRQDFTNFSVLAISLIFALGGAIVIISLFLEALVSSLQLRYRRGLYHQVRWQLDSTLQLQRMTFEGAGLGTWSGGGDDVPVTKKGEKFAPATEWDEWHPNNRGKLVPKEMSIHSRVEL